MNNLLDEDNEVTKEVLLEAFSDNQIEESKMPNKQLIANRLTFARFFFSPAA